ncbi:hypothetical protein M426DRAFT_324583 [Hypoxylon sp. CI-4A]|nr:hypothetical protein M426DRAFT_324583 [Hypoxylon sp. CI-4A]
MVKIQIVSDLHLEEEALYDTFTIPANDSSHCLALLGNNGSFTDGHEELYLRFIMRHLREFPMVLFVVGMSELQGNSPRAVIEILQDFSERIKRKRNSEVMGEFVFLNNSRWDQPDGNLTFLGSTLFTSPPVTMRDDLATYCRRDTGIFGWNMGKHLAAHWEARRYLASEVEEIEFSDPDRHVIILTHHCPTLDERAISPHESFDPEDRPDIYRYASETRGFAPWDSSVLKMWAFGGTGINCKYCYDETLVYSNQRGRHNDCPGFQLFEPLWLVTFYSDDDEDDDSDVQL